MKVAIVHDHLAQDGGAERVLRVLRQMYPQAPIFTLVYNRKHAHPDFQRADIRTSFIQRWPGGNRWYQWYLGWMPTAVERFDLRGYNLVISSCASFAKGVITQPETLHVCYLHSPTRYLWNDTISYVDSLSYPRLVKAVVPHVLNRIRLWDRLAADRVDEFVVNSRFVAQRLEKYYHRPSTVIHPPVDVDKFKITSTVGNYYLTGGRLVSYKRFDLAVEAFNHLGIPLKIYGTGPDLKALKARAKPHIEFLGRIPDHQLNELYGRAIAFINPQVEDFGITAVESMATGRPVIAYAAGGALETVKPGTTGVLFPDQDWEALADAVVRFHPEQFNPLAVRAWAETFSTERFTQTMRQYVNRVYNDYHRKLAS